MKLEEAIVFLLASSGHGMKTEQIAREINERKLYERWDHEPVTGKQVFAVIMSTLDIWSTIRLNIVVRWNISVLMFVPDIDIRCSVERDTENMPQMPDASMSTLVVFIR